MLPRREIRTRQVPVSCDVCGRTLLPGERPDAYLAGGSRRQVCELCTGRALHQGWVRESAEVELSGERPRREERRPFLDRLRGRRERAASRERENGARRAKAPRPAVHDVISDAAAEALFNGAGAAGPATDGELAPDGALAPVEPRHPILAAPGGHDGAAEWEAVAEPRHVHAVPASGEMKAAQALECFNISGHPRTIAGVARSLGVPTVTVRTQRTELSVVSIVVAWELCWYRYEVDLAEEGDPVRQVAQGYELSELDPEDRVANAAADEHGALELLTA